MRLDIWIRLDIWTSHVQRARHRRYLGSQAPHKKRARVVPGEVGARRTRARCRLVVCASPRRSGGSRFGGRAGSVPYASEPARRLWNTRCRGRVRTRAGLGEFPPSEQWRRHGEEPRGLGSGGGPAASTADERVRVAGGRLEAVAVRARGSGVALLALGAGLPLRPLIALRAVGAGRPGGTPRSVRAVRPVEPVGARGTRLAGLSRRPCGARGARRSGRPALAARSAVTAGAGCPARSGRAPVTLGAGLAGGAAGTRTRSSRSSTASDGTGAAGVPPPASTWARRSRTSCASVDTASPRRPRPARPRRQVTSRAGWCRHPGNCLLPGRRAVRTGPVRGCPEQRGKCLRGTRPPCSYLRTGADGASCPAVPPVGGEGVQPDQFTGLLIRISGTDG